MRTWMPGRFRVLRGAVALLAVGALTLVVAGRAPAAPQPVRVVVVKETWGPQPFADADVASMMQGVAQFYATASFGKVAIAYTQTPWLDVMPGPLSCADEATKLPLLATAAGWNPASYDRTVYLIPGGGENGCPNGFEEPGVGALVNDESPNVGVVIHELGHSFGMGHAGLLTCWYQQKKRLCSSDPYGDTADVMGGGGGTSSILAYVGDFGGLQKARAGWLTPTYINKPGVYRLAPVEVASTLPQALVIRGSVYEYWIDLREPVGNDAHLRGPAAIGFAVHRVAQDPFAAGADPLMPDYLVPNANSSSYYTDPGKIFTLPGVFSLTAVSRSHGVMTIRYRKLSN